ncbi:metallophosphoesterase [candidate division WOR-3 bacterium]|nr:metallophosphoesterase [candidate division WOR-3 bacterium]
MTDISSSYSKINILHISDIHSGIEWFMDKKDCFAYANMSLEELLVKKVVVDIEVCLAQKQESIKPDLIIISGDLTQGGKEDQFNSVKRFLKYLLTSLQKAFKYDPPITEEQVVIVPGNHDINFTENQDAYTQFVNDPKPGPESISQKLNQFEIFCKAFYQETSHNTGITFKDGYKIFYFEERNLAVLAFDSCRLVSFAEPAARGWIYGETVLKAIDELNEKKNYPYRIAVFHHNPQIVLEVPEGCQLDFMQNIADINPALWYAKVAIVFHGHCHRRKLHHLFNLPHTKQSGSRNVGVAVGAGSLGGASYTPPRYQMVTIEFQEKRWTVITFPREFTLEYSDILGPGRWKEESVVGEHTRFSTPNPKSKPLAGDLKMNIEAYLGLV